LLTAATSPQKEKKRMERRKGGREGGREGRKKEGKERKKKRKEGRKEERKKEGRKKERKKEKSLKMHTPLGVQHCLTPKSNMCPFHVSWPSFPNGRIYDSYDSAQCIINI
jgi:hypothetical protein